VIRTYLDFDLLPGKADAFIAFFEREAMLSTAVAQGGCRSAELTISDDGLRAVVTAVWDDAAAYERWTSRSDRSELAGELSTYLNGEIDASHSAIPMRIALTGG